MTAFLDDLYARYQARTDAVRDLRDLRPLLEAHVIDDEDRGWLLSALAEGEYRAYFAADVLAFKKTVDEACFTPLLDAALRDPYGSQLFVDALVGRFGARRVLEALVVVYEGATDAKLRFTASTAAYFAQPTLVYQGGDSFQAREPTEASRAEHAACTDLLRRFGEDFEGTSEIRFR